MNLYCFASTSIKNIEIGIDSKTWAVNRTSLKNMRSRITKSKKIKIGALGLFYCMEFRSFTTPFIILSKPDPNKIITDIWDGMWVLPFKILPLGNTSKMVYSQDAQNKWPILLNNSLNNVPAALKITGTTVFVPNIITDLDWEFIVKDLVQD